MGNRSFYNNNGKRTHWPQSGNHTQHSKVNSFALKIRSHQLNDNNYVTMQCPSLNYRQYCMVFFVLRMQSIKQNEATTRKSSPTGHHIPFHSIPLIQRLSIELLHFDCRFIHQKQQQQHVCSTFFWFWFCFCFDDLKII